MILPLMTKQKWSRICSFYLTHMYLPCKQAEILQSLQKSSECYFHLVSGQGEQ